MKYSPLFWPIKLKDNTISILDETALPQRLTYLKVKNYQEACSAIKNMKTRSVGQVILVMYIFLLEIRKNKLKKNIFPILTKVSKAMNATRPTLPFKLLTDMVLAWAKEGKNLGDCIEGFLEMLKNKRVQQARQASELIKDRDVVLTHCNVSGLMPLIGDFCRKQNKKISFLVTESRPYLQGLRLSAWELKRAGFKVTVIADNMVARVMSEGKINKVIVGADHLAQNGDIANKIGTYQIALLARHFNLPFYVLSPPTSSAKTGKDIRIEIRSAKELWEYTNIRLIPKGTKGYYPAFDITPANLISKHIPLEIKI